ncbi:MAG: SDR family oxidoreductase [Anaerolineae bacterium]|nr:SDR family oxidoreductase [Candidatus Roseilinea sp.]MDW8451298.1 SDR family oxidoreductase [Anaerolineae bacterium]
MNLQNKIVAIVGGATGIGKATAEICAAAGATVIVADLNEAEGRATASAVGGSFFSINVADEASVAAAFAGVAAQYGRLDALIQTAGILRGAFVPLEEFDLATFRSVVDVNLIGSFLCAKYAVPLLKKAGKGVIVLVSSGAAIGGSSSYAYGASKGGVNALGITLANKLAADNIRVNVVMPGNIDTAMKRLVIAAERERFGPGGEQQQLTLGEPAGVGRILAWLASDDADYVRGMIQTR